MAMPTVAQMIVWIVVGLIGGGLASRLITWDREGFGTFRNLGLGLLGALIGGLLFRWLNLLPGLDKVSVSLRDVVAAVAGSLLILAVIWLYRRYAKYTIGRRRASPARRRGRPCRALVLPNRTRRPPVPARRARGR